MQLFKIDKPIRHHNTKSMELFGIEFVGFDAENGRKLLLSVVFILTVTIIGFILRKLTGVIFSSEKYERARFWIRQAISLLVAALIIIVFLSIWFKDPTRLATAIGLVTAGLAFALQKVVSSIAGYFVILRGRNFTIGDRISMGGVRGDVIGLGFIQTTIMEMGQPPAVQDTSPAVWVKSRQFTGRIVTVANSKIFDEPVFNYTRDFPFIWEEISIPITYEADRKRAEEIMLSSTNRHVLDITEISEQAVEKLEDRYFVDVKDFDPKVYYRITDNWLELTIRFIVEEHRIRSVKDAINREIIEAFDEAGIGIASATYDIVGLPKIRIENVSGENGKKVN